MVEYNLSVTFVPSLFCTTA